MRLVLFLLAMSGSFLLACGTPTRCSPSTCPVGCCDSSGLCQSGTLSSACGIGGNACARCSVTESCTQGLCATPGGTGGFGTGGGSSGTGGGTGTGGGFATGGGTGMGGGTSGTGGGSSGPAIEVLPASATVPEQNQVELSARVVNGVDNGVNFSLTAGTGRLSQSGPSTAVYFAQSADATVRILASSALNPSLNRVIDITVASGLDPFFVVPEAYSQAATSALAPGSRQTFAAARAVSGQISPFANLVGVRGTQWQVWPTGTIDATGTLTADLQNSRVYAREPATNIWASTPVWVQPTTLPSIALMPAVTTVAPGGVVQFTAAVSTGAAVQWSVASTGAGRITTTGTYTAPTTPGIYLVQAQVGSRVALATVIVQ